MGAITGTSVVNTELVGKKIGYVTATVASASDTVTLTLADHGFSALDVAIPIVTAGFDAAFMHCEASVNVWLSRLHQKRTMVQRRPILREQRLVC